MTNTDTLITKWIIEGKLSDHELGHKVRMHYWRTLHPREHWVWEDDEEEMSGYGYDDASRIYDDGEDEIY